MREIVYKVALTLLKGYIESDPVVVRAEIQSDGVVFWTNTDPYDDSWIQLDDITKQVLANAGIDLSIDIVYNACPGLYNEGKIFLS